MTSTLGLDRLAGRCAMGFDIKAHHPHFCGCREGSEWAVFLDALDRAADAEGRVDQTKLRESLRGRVEPKHVGLLTRRAVREHVIRQIGWEQSTDVAGGNADKQARVYALT